MFLQCLSYIFQCHMAKVINSARPILCRLLRRLKRRTSIGLKNHAMWGRSIANMVTTISIGFMGAISIDEVWWDWQLSTYNYGPHHDIKRWNWLEKNSLIFPESKFWPVSVKDKQSLPPWFSKGLKNIFGTIHGLFNIRRGLGLNFWVYCLIYWTKNLRPEDMNGKHILERCTWLATKQLDWLVVDLPLWNIWKSVGII